MAYARYYAATSYIRAVREFASPFPMRNYVGRHSVSMKSIWIARSRAAKLLFSKARPDFAPCWCPSEDIIHVVSIGHDVLALRETDLDVSTPLQPACGTL